MADNKKHHVNIGVIGHVGYSRKDLDLAIQKALSRQKDSKSFASIDEDLSLNKAVKIIDDTNPFEQLENE